jgi:hypothetical protein
MDGRTNAVKRRQWCEANCCGPAAKFCVREYDGTTSL